MYIIDAHMIRTFATTTPKVTKLHLPVKLISNLTDITEGVIAVYENGVPFSRQKYKNGVGAYQPVLNIISKLIYDYFNNEPNTPNTQLNFDIFHEKLCNTFLTINAERLVHGVPPLTYGNAQKFINVVFKYLTCYADYSDYADLFSHCHMPIDRYVLTYFANVAGVRGCRSNPYPKYNGSSWSKLSAVDYKKLVNNYRTVLMPLYPDFSMLHLEYYIWDAIRSGRVGPFTPIPTVHATSIAEFYM